MWDRYTAKASPRGDEGDWWKIFGYLAKIRTWNATDRVNPATQSFIERHLSNDPVAPIRLEIDLWFRGTPEARARARADIEAIIGHLGGRLLDFVSIEQIQYQVALIEIPAAQAKSVQDRTGALADADEVMLIRPQSLYQSGAPRNVTDGDLEDHEVHKKLRPAVAAVLDGYPVAQHKLLAGRLEVVEVDVKAADVPVNRRYHGTAMASLIIHGDLATKETPITRKLISIPVLAAPQSMSDERLPSELLPIGMIYRAVHALKTGQGDNPPSGPQVILINHSLCDEEGPYVARPSVWARLLDWLSAEYNVLFVVSAGNIRAKFKSGFKDHAAYVRATEAQRQIGLLAALNASKGTRGLLSPAEAMNSLTVGALHLDGAGMPPSNVPDPFSDFGAPNLASATGLGVNRAIKPDIVEAGGRQVAATGGRSATHMVWAREHDALGQSTAAPDPSGGSNSAVMRSSGTSNAAALVTRAGIRIVDAIEEMLAADGEPITDYRTALATRALLVHGAAWGREADLMNTIFPPQGSNQWRARRSSITKFIGYGRPAIEQIIDGDSSRITLLASDEIQHEQLHEYRLPIPASIIKSRELRRITMTLAWNPPLHTTSIAYRGVGLDIVDQKGKRDFWKGISKIAQPHPDDMRRGSLMHFVMEGDNRTAFADAKGLFLGVQARALNKQFNKSKVPYAFAVTLEVATSVREDIYATVANAVRPRARIRS